MAVAPMAMCYPNLVEAHWRTGYASIQNNSCLPQGIAARQFGRLQHERSNSS